MAKKSAKPKPAPEGPARIVCAGCATEKAVELLVDGITPKLLMRWSRVGNTALCGTCFDERFYTRSVMIPVASVDAEEEGAWDRLWTACRTSWREASEICNWLMMEFAKSDTSPLIRNKKGGLTVPPWKAPDHLRNEARNLFHAIDSQSCYDLFKLVHGKYTSNNFRYDCRVKHANKLSEYARLQPFPVPASCYKLVIEHQAHDGKRRPGRGTAVVSFRIAGERFTLRLATGSDWWRAIAALERADAGEAVLGALKVIEGKDKNGKRQIRIAFTAYLPREVRLRDKSMAVTLSPRGDDGRVTRFLEVLIEGQQQPWNMNEDQVKRWVAEHKVRLQRLRADEKLERKQPGPDQANIQQFRDAVCRKANNRINDFVNKAARLLAALAWRNHVGRVVYDDRDHGFFHDDGQLSFPWFMLRTKLEQNLAEFGATLEVVAASDKESA